MVETVAICLSVDKLVFAFSPESRQNCW